MIKTVRKIALITHCRGRRGRRETEKEQGRARERRKAALEGIFHMLPPLRLVSSVKMGKFNIQQFVVFTEGAERGRERERARGGMPWVSCLGRNEKCCWKIWELERSTSKEENVKHVYCHSLYSRELLRKVMKHFYTRLQQHFPAILLQSTLLPFPCPSFSCLWHFGHVFAFGAKKNWRIDCNESQEKLRFAFTTRVKIIILLWPLQFFS